MMRVIKPADRAQVGQDKTFKTPFVAQNFVQQPRIARAGNAVNVMIGGHDAHGFAFADGGFKRFEHDGTDFAFAGVNGRHVKSAFGAAVAGKMFWFGDDRVIGVQVNRPACLRRKPGRAGR